MEDQIEKEQEFFGLLSGKLDCFKAGEKNLANSV